MKNQQILLSGPLSHTEGSFSSGVLAAEKIGDSPIESDKKLGQQMHISAESQSEGTIELVPISWKIAKIISRRRGGT